MGTTELFCFILSKHTFILTKGLCCNTDTITSNSITVNVILIGGVFESCFLICVCVCVCVCARACVCVCVYGYVCIPITIYCKLLIISYVEQM